MLDTLAFSGSAKYPAEELTGLMQTHGINGFPNSSRDVYMVKVDAFRGSIPLAVSMMVDSVFHPTWGAEYVARARQTVSYQNEAFNADPARVISELMMEAAYGPGTALGTSMFATEEGSARITEADMRSYIARMLRPERMVLAGAGVDHDKLVQLAEAELGHLRSFDPATEPADAAPLPMPDTTYQGGLASKAVPLAEGQPGELLTHVSVVFPTMGWRDKRVIALCVMDTLLGGGSSFSAGGPGKGMYTRLYRETLMRNAWVDALNAFSITGDDQGVFGIYGAARPEDGTRLLQTVINNLAMLVDREAGEVEMERARNQLRSTVLMNLESRGILCEDIGRQVLTLGARMETEELCQRISEVTSQDLFDLAADILEATPAVAVINADVEQSLHTKLVDAFASKAVETAARRSRRS